MLVALLFPPLLQAAPQSQLPSPAAPMRPYAGIGVLILMTAVDENSIEPTQFQLYQEPAIVRLGELEIASVPRQEWIFGAERENVPLIVMARKKEWLRVVYDDAGREAWIKPWRRGAYYPWDDFFKDRSGYLLPGLQKKFYQLFREPGSEPLTSLPPRQPFLVTLVEGDWIHLVVSGQNLEGWLRWRDGDGRLLIGIAGGEGRPG